jgi:phosphate uptake regulator
LSNTAPKEEVRKVQLTGGSTYIISLPKKWVEQVGINRGSMMSITQRDDLSLLLQPQSVKGDEETRKALINVSDEISPDSLMRMVLSAYLIGYNIIQLKNPNKRIDLVQRYTVKDFTRKKLVGTEILSDLPNELTLQVLLSHEELSVKDALRRMSLIASSMHRDAIATLTFDDPQLAKEIIAVDDEVDRFSFYIIRLLKAAVTDTQVLREIGLHSPRECLGYRLLTKSIERMADHASKIAHNSLSLILNKIDNEIVKELQSLSESALMVFEDAVDALFEENYSTADKVMEMAERTREMEAGAIQKIIKYANPEDVPAFRLIIESILRTSEYGSDIAEIVLNLTINDKISRVSPA